VKGKRFMEEQIIAVLKETEAGAKVLISLFLTAVIRKLGLLTNLG